MWIKWNRLRRCSIWRQLEFTAQQEKGWAIYWLNIYHGLFHVKCSKWLYSESSRNLSFMHACFCIRSEHANSIAKWALSKPAWRHKLSKAASNKTSDCLLSLGKCWRSLEYILTTQLCESTLPVHVFKRVVGSAASPPRSQSILTV